MSISINSFLKRVVHRHVRDVGREGRLFVILLRTRSARAGRRGRLSLIHILICSSGVLDLPNCFVEFGYSAHCILSVDYTICDMFLLSAIELLNQTYIIKVLNKYGPKD